MNRNTTVLTLNIGTSQLLTIFVLKFKNPFYYLLKPKNCECVANSVDPDQMLHSAASDLGLHCLQRPVRLNT